MELIIEQGNQEGVFNAEHPHETAVALMATMSWIKYSNPLPQTAEETARVVKVLQDLTERLLVMKPGSFKVYEEMMPPSCGKC
jgi:hypothetical protein